MEKDLERFGSKIIKIPTIVDCLKGILTVIPLQLMSYHLATLRGLNVCKISLILTILILISGRFSAKSGKVRHGRII